MNLLVINWRDIEHPEGGGAEVHFHEIFGRLVKRGHTVFLLTTRFPGCAPETVVDGVTVLRWGHTFTFNWEAPVLVRRVMERHRIDCIVDDVNKIPFFSPRWFPRVPVCAFFHHLFGKTVFDLAPWPAAMYVYLMERMCTWGYGRVPCCAVSNSTASDLVAHGFDRGRIVIIENSVDTTRYCPSGSVDKRERLLLHAGRIKSYKNVEIVIRVVKTLCDAGRDVRLAVSGTGDHEPVLRSLVDKLDLGHRVEFLGFVDEDRKIELYRRAMIFVNASFKEGWGITNIEASACGTVVVANDAPGLRDSVRNHETGLLYKENDETDLRACIERLLDDSGLRHKLEAGGREWALRFSWDRSAERVEEWLRQVVQNS